MAAFTGLSELPELVRDSRLEADFYPDASAPKATIHRYYHSRGAPQQEIWIREKLLGDGGFGIVWLEKNQAKGDKLRAIKELKRDKRKPVRDYIRELEALAKFSQNNFVRFFVRLYGWYETPEKLFIAMEYCEHGDMFSYMQENNLPEEHVKDIVWQLLQGLIAMHESNFAHRDLKPLNILIKSKPPSEDGWWVKLCDLGLTKRVEDDRNTTAFISTPGYMAPELLMDEGVDTHDPYASDMWSLGETTFQMLTGQPTFSNRAALRKYVNGSTQFPTSVVEASTTGNHATDFVEMLMAASPTQRMTAKKAAEHVWINSGTGHPDSDRFTLIHSRPSSRDILADKSENRSFPADSAFMEPSGQWDTIASSPSPSQPIKEDPSPMEPSGRWTTIGSSPNQTHSVKDNHPLAETSGQRNALESSSELESKMVERDHATTVNSKQRLRTVRDDDSKTILFSGYKTPVGVMRLHVKGANDLRHYEGLGKSDPYARVLLSDIEKVRTVTQSNTLNPTWDEVLYVPMHSRRDLLSIEVMDAMPVGKDRSLGLIEMFAGDYIEQNDLGEYQVKETTQLRTTELRTKGKDIAAGFLTYSVSFYPCFHIVYAGEPEYFEGMARKEGTQELVAIQELTRYGSGFLIFNLLEGQLPMTGTHLEVYVDDMLYPSYVSNVAKQKHHMYDETGGCFIRELDFSKLTLKVRETRQKPSGERGEDHTVAQRTWNTLDALKQCYNSPTVLKLRSEEDELSSVRVSLRYLPVKLDLDPSESVNNTGSLRVQLLEGSDLPAADGNGKSDPYAKFKINDVEVYKTNVKKKTLNPQWNEFFEIPIPSRTASDLNVQVHHHNFGDKPDLLGAADINLKDLHPSVEDELSLPLDGKSGSIRVQLLFRPGYTIPADMGTNTLSSTFAAPGRPISSRPKSSVAEAVGNRIEKGASFFKRGLWGSRKDG